MAIVFRASFFIKVPVKVVVKVRLGLLIEISQSTTNVGFLLGIYLFMVSSLLCYRRVWADPKLGRDLEFELALVKAKLKHSLRFVRTGSWTIT